MIDNESITVGVIVVTPAQPERHLIAHFVHTRVTEQFESVVWAGQAPSVSGGGCGAHGWVWVVGFSCSSRVLTSVCSRRSSAAVGASS